jgi:hypothetical protein
MRFVPGWQTWDATTGVQLLLRKVKGAKGTPAEGKLFDITCRWGGGAKSCGLVGHGGMERTLQVALLQ